MSTSSEHPPHQELVDFGLGKLDPRQSSQIEQHLDDCDECHDTLLNLGDDTFTGLVRSLAEPDATASANKAEATSAENDRAGPISNSSHAPTMIVQSGEASGPSALPAELQNHPRYRIVEQIGKGGMGEVYRSEHKLMNRPVALKLINSQLVIHPQGVERFRREVQAAARLTHPNIVTAFDAEQAGDVHFLAMEFVEGTDLATVVLDRGPLPVDEACECIRQAAEGLQHAHEQGMVHRDIKPHNLMLSPDGQVRILDFGLASFATESALIDNEATGDLVADTATRHLTALGSVMGTPDYIAPEQARDAHSADIRADIYSLGCTLYYLLGGQPPHKADSIVEKLKAHAEHVPDAIEAIRADVPEDLAEVIRRMMSKDPAERFQTPAEVAAALAPFVAEHSTSVQSAPPRAGIRRFLASPAGWFSAVLLAGVIYVVTADGRIEIRSDVDIEVSVTQKGREVTIIDVQSGTTVHRLPSGEYRIVPKGDAAVKISRWNVTISRFGTEAISIKAMTSREMEEARTALDSWLVLRDNGDFEECWNDAPELVHQKLTRNQYVKGLRIASDAVGNTLSRNLKSRKFRHSAPGMGNGQFVQFEFATDFEKHSQLSETALVMRQKEGDWKVMSYAATVPTAKTADTSTDSDPQALQGTWRSVGIAMDSKATSRGQLPNYELKFDGDRATIPSGNPGHPLTTKFRIDTTTDPAGIDFMNPDAPEARPLTHGIFQIDSGRLRMALVDGDQPRPASWAPIPIPAGFMMLMLRKIERSVGSRKKSGASAEQAAAEKTKRLPLELQVTQAFLAELDNDRFGDAYDLLSTQTKQKTTRDQFSQAMQRLRDTYGTATRRSLHRIQAFDRSAEHPDRTSTGIQYKSEFEKNGEVWESILLTVDSDDEWRVRWYTNTLAPESFSELNNDPNRKKRSTPPSAIGSNSPPRKGGILTNPPAIPPGGVPVGKNLIADPSLEDTSTGSLPPSWSAWLDDGPNFKCEVVEGGVTGKHCLQISGTGTRGVVFCTSVPLDRAKRYTLKGRVRVEGKAGTWAVIKLNYFNSSGWLGVSDRVGVTSGDFDWKFFEKTDMADRYPSATLIVPTCHIEGNGTAWFDDLEVIAYDVETLPADFDAKHGRNNRMK